MIVLQPITTQQIVKAITREANTSDLISVILTEEGTQRTETLTNVSFLSNLYYVNFYLTFSILKEDNIYTLEFIKDELFASLKSRSTNTENISGTNTILQEFKNCESLTNHNTDLNTTIHKAKAYCTQQDPKDFSINNSTYTSNTDDTQFVTL